LLLLGEQNRIENELMTAPPRNPKSVTVDRRRPPPEIARFLKLDHGLGFLVRLLETRATALFEQLTEQSEITPRQFGAMLTLYQRGAMTLTELASHLRIDRSTLGEMVNRMSDKGLVRKESNDADRRSATVSIAKGGEQALMKLVSSAAQLQEDLLAPLPAEDRPFFMKCMRLVAEPPDRESSK